MTSRIHNTAEVRLRATGAEGEYLLLAFPFYSEGMAVNDDALRQIVDFCGIPWAYAERMKKGAPRLLCSNVNYWLDSIATERRIEFGADGVFRFASPKR